MFVELFYAMPDKPGQYVVVNVSHIVSFWPDRDGTHVAMAHGTDYYIRGTPAEVMEKINAVLPAAERLD